MFPQLSLKALSRVVSTGPFCSLHAGSEGSFLVRWPFYSFIWVFKFMASDNTNHITFSDKTCQLFVMIKAISILSSKCKLQKNIIHILLNTARNICSRRNTAIPWNSSKSWYENWHWRKIVIDWCFGDEKTHIWWIQVFMWL